MASLEQVAAAAIEISVSTGEQPITQGDTGDRFYVIASGRADVLIDGFRVRELGPGDSFGERALLRDTPRTATVQALVDMRLLAVGRDVFMEALTGRERDHRRLSDQLDTPIVDLLSTLAMFKGVAEAGLERVAESATRAELAEGTVVFEVDQLPDARLCDPQRTR